MKTGQFFGERALRTLEKRAATISVADKGTVILLSMEGKHFEDLLGPVLEVIDDKINEYKRSAVMVQQDEEIKRRKRPGKDKNKATADAKAICGLKELKTIGVLGKGGFGLVTLVQDPKSGKSYALKAIKKYQVSQCLRLMVFLVSIFVCFRWWSWNCRNTSFRRSW